MNHAWIENTSALIADSGGGEPGGVIEIFPSFSNAS
jgi:hypothetical protein